MIESPLMDKLIWLSIIAFLAAMIFSIAIVQILVGVMTTLWLIKIILIPGHKFIATQFDAPVLIFVAARVLSVFFSVDLSTSLPALYKEIPFYILFFAITNNISVLNKEKVKKLIWILIISGCIAALYGSAKVLFGFEERASSTTSGYSTLGMFLAVMISFTLWIGRNEEFFPARWIWSLSLLIMGSGLLLTFNRTHWGVVGVILLIVGLFKERIALLVTLGLGGLAIVFVPGVSERFYQMIHFLEYTSGRNIIWQGAFMLFASHPVFGFGPRTFEEIFPLYNQLEDKLIASWHNDYLQLYMESGIFGLIGFLWLIIAIYYFGAKVARQKKIDPFYKDITIAILLGMTAFFLTGLVGGFIIDPITSLLFRFLLALLALISILHLKQKEVNE